MMDARVCLISTPFLRSIGLLLITVLLLPINSSSQSSLLSQVQRREEIISALLKLRGSQDGEIRSLLDGCKPEEVVVLWNVLVDRGAAAYFLTNHGKSLSFYEAAIGVAEYLKDKRRLATTYYDIGRTHAGSDKIKEAIQAHLTCKRIIEEAGLQRDLVYVLSDLGSLYLYLQDYKQARMYVEESLRLADAVKHSNAPAGAFPDNYGVA